MRTKHVQKQSAAVYSAGAVRRAVAQSPPAVLSEESQSSRIGWLTFVLALAVAGATVWTHWPVLGAQAVMSDDRQYVHQNRLVQSPSWESTKRFLSEVLEPSTVGGYYQPLAMISLMADYAMGGRPDDYRVFHITSLALHAACAVMVTMLLLTLFKQPWAAAAGGLLFGLHPGAVESVAWVSDRKTLLATLFALSAIIAYVRYTRLNSANRWGWYAACMVLFTLALLSKPTVTPLPVVMLVMDAWPLRRFGKRAVLEKIPMLALSAATALITVISQGRTADVRAPADYPLWAPPLILCHNAIFYLRKILWPVDLSAHYPWPTPFTISHPAVLGGLVGTIALIALLIITLRWTGALFASCLMFFIALLPAMGLIGFTVAIAADRFAYLAKVALLLPLGYFLAKVIRERGALSPRSLGILGLVILAGAGEALSARRYIAHWSDTEGFARYLVDSAPQSAHLHTSLANILSGRGKIDEAAQQYRQALQLDDDANAHFSLGILLAAQNQWEVAEHHLRESIRIYPKNVEAYSNLAIVLERRGRPDEATRQIEEALRRGSKSETVQFQAGMIHFLRGRLDDAAARFAQALAINPHLEGAAYQYGCLLMCQGKTEEGIKQWQTAYHERMDRLDVMNNLAWIWATCDDPKIRAPKAAMRLAERACAMTSNQDPSLLDTLAAAYAADRRFEDAAATARRSIQRWEQIGNSAAAAEVRKRLALYEAGKPYREPVNREAYRAQ